MLLSTSSSDPSQSSLQIKQDDKFYTRLLSKENSMANPSFRVYYGGASGAVPFMWESQPGTPKNTLPTTTLPPLTPPPSYYSNHNDKDISITNKSSKSKLMINTILLPWLSPKKKRTPSSPLIALSSSSESSLSPMGSSISRRPSRFSSWRSSFSSRSEDEESDGGSPTSTPCFRPQHRVRGGCFSILIVKNALLSVVGSHGSRQGIA